MTQQVIITTPANSGIGSSPKAAFDICNANFTDVYTQVGALNNQSAGVSVLNYGADPTGAADSTAAIQSADAAATAAGLLLYFPPGTYAVNMSIGLVRGGASWLGAGRNVSILKATATSITTPHYLVQIDNKSNFTTSRLGFDISLPTFSSGAQGSSALLCVGGTNWETFDCAFTGIQAYTNGTYPNGGDQWSVKDCYFNMPTPSTNYNQAINVQNPSGRHQVCRNTCVGTGIFSQAGEGLFEGNIVTGWKFGAGITIDAVFTSRGVNNRIIGNYCLNGAGNPDVNSVYSAGIENSSGNAIIVGNHCYNNQGPGINLFGPNCLVTGNQCLNNNQAGSVFGGITAYDVPQASGGSLGASGSIIVDNVLSDTQGSPTQAYGYLEQNHTNGFGTGSLHNMLVARNVATGNTTAAALYVGTAPLLDFVNGPLQVAAQVAPTSGGSATCGVLVSSTANLGLFFGTGAPTFSAAEGAIYSNTTGAAGARLYVNTSSGSGTTWTALTTP